MSVTCLTGKSRQCNDLHGYMTTLIPSVYNRTVHSICRDSVMDDSFVCDFWDTFMDYAPCIIEFQKDNLSSSLYDDIVRFWETCKWDSEDDWERLSRESVLQETEMELYMHVYRKKASSGKDIQIIKNFLSCQKISEQFFWDNSIIFASFVDNNSADNLSFRFLTE